MKCTTSCTYNNLNVQNVCELYGTTLQWMKRFCAHSKTNANRYATCKGDSGGNNLYHKRICSVYNQIVNFKNLSTLLLIQWIV